MNPESGMQVTCGTCNALLKAKPKLAGKRVKCPKCGAAIQVPTWPPQEPSKKSPPATERQKEYAQSLGIAFPPGITRADISKLIDDAVTKRDDERYDRLEDLSRRESEAYDQLRQQVLADIDAEDCRLSKAEPSQIVEALSERRLAAVLVTMPLDEIDDFEDLQGVSINISFSDDMSREDMEAVVMSLGCQFMKQRGII